MEMQKKKKNVGHHTGSASGNGRKIYFVAEEYQFVKCRPNPAILWDIPPPPQKKSQVMLSHHLCACVCASVWCCCLTMAGVERITFCGKEAKMIHVY